MYHAFIGRFIGRFIGLFTLFIFTSISLSSISLAGIKKATFCSQKYKELFESFTPQDPLTLPIKVGIELEFSQPLKTDLNSTAELIRKNIATRYPDAKLTRLNLVDEYEITYQKANLEIKKWTVKTDRSIQTSQTPVEITSPILEDAEDFLQFRKIVNAVKNSGAKIEPRSGGVHVHVDFSHTDIGELATLAAVFSEIEEELKNIFSIHPSRSEFIQSTSDGLRKFINENSFNLKDSRTPLISALLDTQDRRHALNLRSYTKFSTVEFRLFNSTFNLDALELMSDFSAKLVQGVRTQNPELMKYLGQENEKIQLNKIATILKMKLAEPNAKQILEKIFRESGKFNLSQRPETHDVFALRISQILGTAAAIHLLVEKTESLLES